MILELSWLLNLSQIKRPLLRTMELDGQFFLTVSLRDCGHNFKWPFIYEVHVLYLRNNEADIIFFLNLHISFFHLILSCYNPQVTIENKQLLQKKLKDISFSPDHIKGTFVNLTCQYFVKLTVTWNYVYSPFKVVEEADKVSIVYINIYLYTNFSHFWKEAEIWGWNQGCVIEINSIKNTFFKKISLEEKHFFAIFLGKYYPLVWFWLMNIEQPTHILISNSGGVVRLGGG